MARQKSDKSKFRSIYSNSYVTAAQYITEALFYLIAKSKNIDLPENFWNHEDWKKDFQYQVVLVNRLLKEYSPHAILKTLRDKRCRSVYSFGIFKKSGNLKKILDTNQKHIQYQDSKEVQISPRKSVTDKPRKPTGSKNILALLEETENE